MFLSAWTLLGYISQQLLHPDRVTCNTANGIQQGAKLTTSRHEAFKLPGGLSIHAFPHPASASK
jgi:hypothetical protein